MPKPQCATRKQCLRPSPAKGLKGLGRPPAWPLMLYGGIYAPQVGLEKQIKENMGQRNVAADVSLDVSERQI